MSTTELIGETKLSCAFVIPHRNQFRELKECLDALSKLDRTGWSIIETIVIDNGSIGWDSMYWSEFYPTILFEEYTDQFNPYACRNLGISRAKSDWIGLLDVKSRIDADWLFWVARSIDKGSSLVAGRFVLEYLDENISSKVHGMLYLLNRRNFRHRRGFPSGNLLVAKELFERFGLFETDLPTGNDIIWTQRLVNAQVSSEYNEKMIVHYKAKAYKELRISVCKYAWGVGSRMSIIDRFWTFSRACMPMRPSVFSAALEERELTDLLLQDKCQLYWWVWRAKFLYGICLLTSWSEAKKEFITE